MATNSFNISYIIKAVDKFSPVIKNVQKNLKSLDKNIAGIGGKGLKKVADKAKKVETNFKKVAEQTQIVKSKIQAIPPKIDIITAKTNKAALSAKKLGDRFKQAGQRAKNIGKSLALRVTAPLLAVGALSIRNAKIQLVAEQKVKTGVKLLGERSAFTAEQLFKQASALQLVSNFGDEDILGGAINSLLRFEGIATNPKIFKAVLQGVIDIAAKTKKPLQGVADTLGRALQEPLTQLSLLERSVTFSAKEKERIKELAKAGDLMGAQLAIIKKVRGQFGGFAKDLSEDDVGKLNQGMMALGDSTEAIGKILIRRLVPFLTKIKEISLAFDALSDETKDIIVTVGIFAAVLAPLLITLGFLAIAISAIGLPITLIIVAIAAITFVFFKFRDDIEETMIDLLGEDGFAALLNIVDVIKNSFVDTFKVIFGLIGKFFSIIGKVIKFFSGGRKKFLGLEVEEFRKIAFESKGSTSDFGGLSARTEPLGEAARNFGIRSTVDLNMNIRDKGRNVESIQASPGVKVATTKGSNSPFRLSDLVGAV